MANFTTITAGEDLVRGRVTQPNGTYVDDATSAPGIFITFEPLSDGEVGTVYAGGSAQVPCEASGTISAGQLVQATTDGKVIANNTPASGSLMLGFAETSASDGETVYITFCPASV